MRTLPTPDIGAAMANFLKGENIDEFQSDWIAKLETIVKEFDALGIVKIKNSSKT
jgi:hypothetical protein